ncbi:MAG TPA: HD domain-containing phosphohydrolase [Gammaproteobacteria bacterium]
MKILWYKSLKIHIAAALLLQLILISILVGTTIYQLDLRKHDYAILNLAGQLRVISQVLVKQSYNYKQNAPRDYESYERDLGLYNKDLHDLIQNYSDIIKAFKERNLPVELTGQQENLYCNWDRQSRNQLDITADYWNEFRQGLLNAIGNNPAEPKLEAAAQYVLLHEKELLESSTRLANAFQLMMESKLKSITRLNHSAIVAFIIINLIILAGFYLRFIKPLNSTLTGFQNVAKGNLKFQLPVGAENEIGYLRSAFNHLTTRLASLFRLSDRMQQATNLDDALKIVYEEFRKAFSIEWVGLFMMNATNDAYVLERQYSDGTTNFNENESFTAEASELFSVTEKQLSRKVDDLSGYKQHDELLLRLKHNQLSSVIMLPLHMVGKEDSVLVLAARESHAYDMELSELLENIATQLGHAMNKTIGMEGLVISAISGLAKLAESRDPETGDHLERMSLYSAILAEELGHNEKYRHMITPAYIRSVFQFAPMHDIGKVGVEDRILLKPASLDAEERRLMQEHPVIGASVLHRCEAQMNMLGLSIFSVGIEIAIGHHEKYDGSGYPNQLIGEAIPLSARIVAVADVFDALTSKRPYKEAWSIDEAMVYMQEQSGKHFDPDVIQALENSMDKILQVYEERKHV